MIAVMIQNGGGDAQGHERGNEYDTMSGNYAEYIEAEVLPAVEKNYEVKLTRKPDGRAAMGSSSGASAALTMAWFHPDLYHRVISYSGTFVNQQWPFDPRRPDGAWGFHTGDHPTAPTKPIRIFITSATRICSTPTSCATTCTTGWRPTTAWRRCSRPRAIDTSTCSRSTPVTAIAGCAADAARGARVGVARPSIAAFRIFFEIPCLRLVSSLRGQVHRAFGQRLGVQRAGQRPSGTTTVGRYRTNPRRSGGIPSASVISRGVVRPFTSRTGGP